MSISTPTLRQQPFLNINLRQVEIMQHYEKKESYNSLCQKFFFFYAKQSIVYATTLSGFNLYAKELWHSAHGMQTGSSLTELPKCQIVF